ncbi:MAG: hypothetical protein GX242_06490 [Clostridiales bacterium]|nr:hypothetical protein [Clostridiales bacterium]
MSGVLISITAISLISILAEALLTEGQTKKYIQGILSLAIVLVFLAGITALVKGNKNFEDYIDIPKQELVGVNSDTLTKLEQSRYNLAQKSIESLLEKQGIEGVKITFSFGYNETGNIFVQNIYADTSSSVINSNSGNININDKIVDACQSVVNINKEGIIIDGKVAV